MVLQVLPISRAAQTPNSYFSGSFKSPPPTSPCDEVRVGWGGGDFGITFQSIWFALIVKYPLTSTKARRTIFRIILFIFLFLGQTMHENLQLSLSSYLYVACCCCYQMWSLCLLHLLLCVILQSGPQFYISQSRMIWTTAVCRREHFTMTLTQLTWVQLTTGRLTPVEGDHRTARLTQVACTITRPTQTDCKIARPTQTDFKIAHRLQLTTR